MAKGHKDPTSMRLNRFIEEANFRRENLHDYFRLNKRTAALGLIFGVAVPALLFCATKKQQVLPDNIQRASDAQWEIVVFCIRLHRTKVAASRTAISDGARAFCRAQ